MATLNEELAPAVNGADGTPCNDGDVQLVETPKDLLKLKEISEKLNLSTRRASVVQWKQVIEYRKSRGQYVAVPKSQRAAANHSIKPSDRVEDVILNNNQNNGDVRSAMGTNHSLRSIHKPSSAALPTPDRRHRRSGQIAIPLLIVEEDGMQVKIEDAGSGDKKPAGSLSQPLEVLRCAGKQLKPTVETKSMNSPNTIRSRYRNVNQAFEEIRKELVLMRIEDNKLARRLLDIRSEMNLLRAQWSCDEHAEMIDVVAYEILEEEELTGLLKACDLSSGNPASLFSHFSPLRSIGVNRMNFNTRRFSIR